MNVKNLIGRPTFKSGDFLGYVLWKHSDGFHLKWSAKGKKTYNFQGKITSEAKLAKKVRLITGDRIEKVEKNTIEWNSKVEDEDEVRFLTPGSFTVELKINKKKIKAKNIFLGPQMIQPDGNPFKVIQETSEELKERGIKLPIRVTEPEPVYTSEPEPIYEPEPEPEPTYEPEPELKPVYAPEPEPTYEPESELEPVYAPEPEPIYEPESELEPTYEPESELEPVYAPEPEPIYEPE
ncbi:MAG: hypothetical protein ACFFBT_01225, partial [Promethearchaeota archaeon]